MCSGSHFECDVGHIFKNWDHDINATVVLFYVQWWEET